MIPFIAEGLLNPEDIGVDSPYEGELADQAATIAVHAMLGSARFAARIDPATRRIVAVAHQGADSQEARAAIDRLCGVILGLSVDEAADHGAIRLIHLLRSRMPNPPAMGIVLPQNSGQFFVNAARTLRNVRDQFRLQVSTADRSVAEDTDAQWRALAGEERISRLHDALSRYLKEHGLAEDAICCEALEENVRGSPVRVIASFAPSLVGESLPRHIRGLERRFKRELSPGIEVLLGEREDRNKLRRMIVIQKAQSQE